MGYVAVEGGVEAIENAEQLSQYVRLKGQSVPIQVKQIQDQMRLLVDRVMGEGGLYSPFHAALALKQAEGDPIEASFLLRAFRSTLPRIKDSETLKMDEMRLLRRISAAFKNIPGGQILGPTSDYRQRLLDFSLLNEDEQGVEEKLSVMEIEAVSKENVDSLDNMPKVVEMLRTQGYVQQKEQLEMNPAVDLTQEALSFPAHRSARLQAMARGETGGLLAIAYSSMRGYGDIHPTVAELRVGYLPIRISHPHRSGELMTVGSMLITEAELVAQFEEDAQEDTPTLTLGYGVCFGHNEIKVISMAVLDKTMKAKEPKVPAEDQEFVLSHIDGIESSGFCAHYKLPHYITFQSDLDRLRDSQRYKTEGINSKQGGIEYAGSTIGQ
jgi:alpha-D-ribose 1-methylphosphonate 5-triphosphate synthase subunit PhnI